MSKYFLKNTFICRKCDFPYGKHHSIAEQKTILYSDYINVITWIYHFFCSVSSGFPLRYSTFTIQLLYTNKSHKSTVFWWSEGSPNKGAGGIPVLGMHKCYREQNKQKPPPPPSVAVFQKLFQLLHVKN